MEKAVKAQTKETEATWTDSPGLILKATVKLPQQSQINKYRRINK